MRASFAVFDTSVYIENFRTGRFTFRMLHTPVVPRCSSVVLHELRRGAQSRLERRFVDDLRKNCQVLVPTASHWIEAADVLSAIRNREHYDARKIRELAFDVLIALSARSIGATVITCNESDFQTIRRHMSFHVMYWK